MTSNNRSTTPLCVIDRSILNEKTVGDLEDIGLSIFATTCGRNRGAFVIHPPDGHTYGCTDFPDLFALKAGVHNVSIPDSNAISKLIA